MSMSSNLNLLELGIFCINPDCRHPRNMHAVLAATREVGGCEIDTCRCRRFMAQEGVVQFDLAPKDEPHVTVTRVVAWGDALDEDEGALDTFPLPDDDVAGWPV
jgi:hypothetical protein